MMSYLRELNMASILLRLLLAMLFGGLVGAERGRKRRAAGMRTYMLVCMGAALTVLLSQYEYGMLTTVWADIAGTVGQKTDVSRFGAQVINGVGFLGAGTVLVTSRQEVKGLTTAAGLWASACVGLAIGAGFYEGVVLAFLLILLVMRTLPAVEKYVVENGRNMNLYIEFDSLDAIGPLIAVVKAAGARIYSVDIERDTDGNPSAVLNLKLSQRKPHAQVIASLADAQGVVVVNEI